MGTCLSAAVQLHYPATALARQSYDTVAVFEFNKDYSLSARLFDLQPAAQWTADEWWPCDAREYGCNRQTFTVQELPSVVETYEPEQLASGWGDRYQALLDVCTRLGPERVRVLFWRDQ